MSTHGQGPDLENEIFAFIKVETLKKLNENISIRQKPDFPFTFKKRLLEVYYNKDIT